MNLRLPHLLLPALLVGTLSSCSSWQRTEQYGGWSLYVKSGETVSSETFHGAVQPAFEAVERELGPFKKTIKVHAWNGGVAMDDGTKGRITSGDDGTVTEVSGIGPARVRAFHARGDGGFFSLSGVFVGTADEGTAVHELVHAHLAENEEHLPLWFEEGFAMIMGDGAMFENEWVVDGLACWPWRELRDIEMDDEQFKDLLSLSSTKVHSVRDNVLVHFVGWAIVFDLYREVGSLDWREMYRRHNAAEDPLKEARIRYDRTLRIETVESWLSRLQDPDPGRRLAAARGTWKLHSHAVQGTLLSMLRDEKHAEVRASFAVNALATAGQVRLGRRRTGWMWRSVFPVLKRTVLECEDETSALRALYRAYRYGNQTYNTQAALEQLDRFWED